MENQTKSNSSISILRYAGTYIGAVIGSGFASGQEPLQFFASYGYWGFLGAILVIVLFAWYGYLFMAAGYKLQTSTHQPVLNYLCGNVVGRIFDWILTFFLFGVLAIMISGGGAALGAAVLFMVLALFSRIQPDMRFLSWRLQDRCILPLGSSSL